MTQPLELRNVLRVVIAPDRPGQSLSFDAARPILDAANRIYRELGGRRVVLRSPRVETCKKGLPTGRVAFRIEPMSTNLEDPTLFDQLSQRLIEQKASLPNVAELNRDTRRDPSDDLAAAG